MVVKQVKEKKAEMARKRTAVVTIASRNYFASVETLMASIKETNANYDCFAAVADDISDDFIKSLTGEYQLLTLEEIELPCIKRFEFRYSILEFNTAIKPYVLQNLLNKGYERVIYFDPDICVYNELSDIEKLLDAGNSIVLTPHILGPMEEDGEHPNEITFLKCGIYNLGFLAVQRSDSTLSFLEWWKRKLEYDCVSKPEKGLFVDQRWIDFLPAWFKDIGILRHPGCNVAYWNLIQRKVSNIKGEYMIDGEKLIFFHFSGFNPDKSMVLSKYSTRYKEGAFSEIKELVEQYARALKDNKVSDLKNINMRSIILMTAEEC